MSLKKTYLFFSVDLNREFWDASLYVSPSRWPLEGPRKNKVYAHLTANKRPHLDAMLDLRWSVFLFLTYFSHVIVSRFIHSSANGTIPFLFMAEQYSIMYICHIVFILKSSLKFNKLYYQSLYLITPQYTQRGFPDGVSGKEPVCQCRRYVRCKLNPWIQEIPWMMAWQFSILLRRIPWT